MICSFLSVVDTVHSQNKYEYLTPSCDFNRTPLKHLQDWFCQLQVPPVEKFLLDIKFTQDWLNIDDTGTTLKGKDKKIPPDVTIWCDDPQGSKKI